MKKFIALFVCIMILTAIMAGCGSNQKNSSGSSANNSVAASTSTETAVTSTEAELVTLNLYRVQWGDVPLDNPIDAPIKQKIKEKLNIDINIVGPKNPSNQLEKFWVMYSAGEQIDIVTGGIAGADYNRLSRESIIIPLNDLLETNGPDLKQNIDMEVAKFAYGDKDGNILAIPYESNTLNDGAVLQIKSDVLTKYNMKTPETIEEFEAYLKASKDEKLSGLVPHWPGALNDVFAGCFIPVPCDNGLLSNYQTSDGKIEPWYTHEKVKDYLAVMQNWYKNGWINKEFAIMNGDQFNNEYHSGKASGAMMYWTNVLDADNLDLPQDVPAAIAPLKLKIYEPIYTPKGPAGSHMKKGVGWGGDGVAITKQCKAPDRAMDYLNYTVGNMEGFNLARAGVEGINYNLIDVNGKKVYDPIEGKTSSWWHYTVPLKKLNVDPGNLFSRQYMNELVDFMDKMPTEYTVDYKVKYDYNSMNSNNKMNDMNTLINESMNKIIMGVEPVSSWDNTIKKWKEIGGDIYIVDLTAQFNTQNK